jgi:hypothetical protein
MPWTPGRRAFTSVTFKRRVKALIQLLVQKDSVEERSRSIFEVHEDSGIHSIHVGNFPAHGAILVLYGRKFSSSSYIEFGPVPLWNRDHSKTLERLAKFIRMAQERDARFGQPVDPRSKELSPLVKRFFLA